MSTCEEDVSVEILAARLERDHEDGIMVLIDPPRLPGLAIQQNIRPWCYPCVWIALNERLGFGIPGSQLVQSVSFHIDFFFSTAIENDMLKEGRLKDVILVEDTGAEVKKR